MRKKVIFPVLLLILIMIIIFSIPNFAFAIVQYPQIYVNGVTGDDAYNGTSPTHIGASVIGPKKTIGGLNGGISAVSSGGTVYVAKGTYYENLVINHSFTLQGSGADNTSIIGSSGSNVVWINTGTVIINDLIIKHSSGVAGRGILNLDTLTIDNCIISGNQETQGGGIANGGTLTINSSTISGNQATQGGGIFNFGNLIIDSSIISGNQATGQGGAIRNNANLTIHNSTVADNTSPNASGIHDISTGSAHAENNWWGTPTGPGGGIADAANPTIFANGSGDSLVSLGHLYFYPWLASDPFKQTVQHKEKAEVEEPVWIRTMPMTCYQVWVNSDNKFEFVFWYPYRDNNWVKIYDMSGKEVYSVDMPLDDPHIIVDLPNGMYTVKTFNDQPEPLQTFIIGK